MVEFLREHHEQAEENTHGQDTDTTTEQTGKGE